MSIDIGLLDMAELPLMVALTSVTVPPIFRMPPPRYVAELPPTVRESRLWCLGWRCLHPRYNVERAYRVATDRAFGQSDGAVVVNAAAHPRHSAVPNGHAHDVDCTAGKVVKHSVESGAVDDGGLRASSADRQVVSNVEFAGGPCILVCPGNGERV